MPAKPLLPPTRPRPRAPGPVPLRAAAALAFACLLGACGPKDNEFAPACPGLSVLPDAADVSRFNGEGFDIRDLVVHASITAVPAACEPGKTGFVRATLHVNADIERGPTVAHPPAVPYFIALMKGDTVLREQDFALSGGFPANVDRTSVTGEDIELQLPVGKDGSAAGYHIYVGFRVSADELAYNRAHAQP